MLLFAMIQSVLFWRYCIEIYTYLSAHGMSARPEKAKQAVSPSQPIASPTRAIGPNTSNQFSLLLRTNPDEYQKS